MLGTTLYLLPISLLIAIQSELGVPLGASFWMSFVSVSGVPRLVKFPGHLVGPVAQEFEILILLQVPPNPCNEKSIYN